MLFMVIVLVVGLGMCFLLVIKMVFKELLFVVDIFGIELVVVEVVVVGVEWLVIVIFEGKDGVVVYFVEDLVLEGMFEV